MVEVLARRGGTRRLLPWAAILIVAGLLAGAGWSMLAAARGGQQDPAVLFRDAVPEAGMETTLQEAWKVAEAAAEGWSGDWAIVRAYSTDVNDTPVPDSGRDGRHRSWQFELADGAGSGRLLRVTGGAAVAGFVTAVVGGKAPGVAGAAGLPPPALDSDAAVAIVLRRYPQLAGSSDGKQVGFHFHYEPSRIGLGPALTVMAAESGSVVAVEIDPERDEIRGARRRAFESGPLLVSTDGGQTWPELMPRGERVVRLDSGRPPSAPPLIAVTTPEGTAVREVGPGGLGRSVCVVKEARSLASVGDLIGDGDGSVYLAGDSGLYRCRAGSFLAERVAGGAFGDLEIGPAGLVHAIVVETRDSSRHVRVIPSGEVELVGAAPGLSWLVRTGDSVYAVGPGDEVPGLGIAAAQVAVLADGEAYAIDFERGLLRRRASDGTWELVRAGPTSDLAVASRGQGPALIAASFWRDGVYVSTDGGDTWQKALPGAREGWELAVDASGAIYAARRGEYEWGDY